MIHSGVLTQNNVSLVIESQNLLPPFEIFGDNLSIHCLSTQPFSCLEHRGAVLQSLVFSNSPTWEFFSLPPVLVLHFHSDAHFSWHFVLRSQRQNRRLEGLHSLCRPSPLLI